MPSSHHVLQNEAQRIALLMQLARDEAILRNSPIAFEAEENHYRFLVRSGNQWQPMAQDDLLRQREFTRPPVMLSITPSNAGEKDPFRIVFGREPVDKPFVLTFSSGNASAVLRADGIGHFVVE